VANSCRQACFGRINGNLSTRPEEDDDPATLIHVAARTTLASELNGHPADHRTESPQDKLKSAFD